RIHYPVLCQFSNTFARNFPLYMDRNQIIGFSLLAALLIAYIGYNNNAQNKYKAQKTADSIAYAKAHPKPAIDSSKIFEARAKDTVNDSLRRTLPAAFHGAEETVMLENGKIALQFSTKGAFPVSAL